MRFLSLGLLLAAACSTTASRQTGTAPAPLTGSAEQYRAQAQDARRPLAQRLESALNASTLAPKDEEARKLLHQLFYDRHLELAAAARDSKAPALRPFKVSCGKKEPKACITAAFNNLVYPASVWAVARDGLFAVALGSPARTLVYRGQYQLPQEAKSPEDAPITGEVLASERLAPGPVLAAAVFPPDQSGGDWFNGMFSASLPPGHFTLDPASEALLRALPQQWALLEPAVARDGTWVQKVADCNAKKPLVMKLEGDILGRWSLSTPGGTGGGWISSVKKAEDGLDLTLVRKTKDRLGEQVMSLDRVRFKPPRGDGIGYLGEQAVSPELERHPLKPCL